MAAADVAAMVAAVAADSDATHPAGARRGRAGTERVEPGPEPELELERSRAGGSSLRAPAASSAAAPRRPPAPREGARRRLHPPPPAPRAPSFFHPSSRLPGSSMAARGRGRRLRDPLPRGWHRLRDRGFQVQLRPGKSEGACYSWERVPL